MTNYCCCLGIARNPSSDTFSCLECLKRLGGEGAADYGGGKISRESERERSNVGCSV